MGCGEIGMTLSVGERVGIRCDVSPGPFPGEFLVTFETVSDPVSGFVQESAILSQDDGEGYVIGVVETITETEIKVRVSGSFFTTNGLAWLSQDWARANVRSVRKP